MWTSSRFKCQGSVDDQAPCVHSLLQKPRDFCTSPQKQLSVHRCCAKSKQMNCNASRPKFYLLLDIRCSVIIMQSHHEPRICIDSAPSNKVTHTSAPAGSLWIRLRLGYFLVEKSRRDINRVKTDHEASSKIDYFSQKNTHFTGALHAKFSE